MLVTICTIIVKQCCFLIQHRTLLQTQDSYCGLFAFIGRGSDTLTLKNRIYLWETPAAINDWFQCSSPKVFQFIVWNTKHILEMRMIITRQGNKNGKSLKSRVDQVRRAATGEDDQCCSGWCMTEQSSFDEGQRWLSHVPHQSVLRMEAGRSCWFGGMDHRNKAKTSQGTAWQSSSTHQSGLTSCHSHILFYLENILQKHYRKYKLHLFFLPFFKYIYMYIFLFLFIWVSEELGFPALRTFFIHTWSIAQCTAYIYCWRIKASRIMRVCYGEMKKSISMIFWQ